jgi:hypothetical protein
VIFDDSRLVRARDICEALGMSRRTLFTYVQAGGFPPPDRPARRKGEPDLWKLSTARAGIQAYASAKPARDPGAQIAA